MDTYITGQQTASKTRPLSPEAKGPGIKPVVVTGKAYCPGGHLTEHRGI